MKFFLFSFIIFTSVQAWASGGLLPNKCWNTRLSKEDRKICDYCIDKVGVEKDVNNPCEKQQNAVNECFANNLDCEPPYDVLLKENYNCRTALVNDCFEEQKRIRN
jgi:hypothetical protein